MLFGRCFNAWDGHAGGTVLFSSVYSQLGRLDHSRTRKLAMELGRSTPVRSVTRVCAVVPRVLTYCWGTEPQVFFVVPAVLHKQGCAPCMQLLRGLPLSHCTLHDCSQGKRLKPFPSLCSRCSCLFNSTCQSLPHLPSGNSRRHCTRLPRRLRGCALAHVLSMFPCHQVAK